MCTRILSGALTLTILFITSATGLQRAPSAQKLPSTLMSKQPLAYFSFDRKGRALSSNQIKTGQTIQLRGAHFTPEGLDQGALRCTGSAQVRIPLPMTSKLTFSAWFLPADLARRGSFTACTLQSKQHTLTVNLHQNGTIQMRQTSPFSQGSSSVNTGLGLPANQWLHLALVATPQQLTLYLNGQGAGSFNIAVPLSRARLLVGGNTYRGRLDEVALFGQSLTPQDIQALFAMHKPAATPGVSQLPQGNAWEAKAVRSYAELTRAINSGNWSVAATQATAVSDLVSTYQKDQKTHLTRPAQGAIKDNLAKAANLLKAFQLAIEQAKYHEASDLFDRLDEVWETLEDQLTLPVSNGNAIAGVPLLAPGRQQPAQFSQTWSSNSGAMPGSRFSGGMSMGGFGNANSGGGGGFSVSSSSGPNGQFRLESSGIPGQGFMGQSPGQMPPQMVQQKIHMQCQRIQMTLMPLRMNLRIGNWKMAQANARRLPPLLASLTPPDKVALKSKTRTRRRTLNLSALPPARQVALKTKARQAMGHIKRLDTALEKQQLDAAYAQLHSLETMVQGLRQWPNKAIQSVPSPEKSEK
jgi:hypothetical protein